jgi:uracil-DNA glycosylase
MVGDCALSILEGECVLVAAAGTRVWVVGNAPAISEAGRLIHGQRGDRLSRDWGKHYLAHKGDPPPGNMVMWRGITRLADIVLGLSITEKLVGN